MFEACFNLKRLLTVQDPHRTARVGCDAGMIPDPDEGLTLEKQAKDVYNNAAQLKDLMTARPMTAAQHAAINRKRIRARRMLEDARERRSSANELF